jgi:phosphatidylserine/phosphatidylglycerophosphate/cardiolipin synthase-like enzyme
MKLVIATAFALLAVPAAAQTPEWHYAPAENLERIDVALIDDAGESIDIAAYVLTDVPVIEALTLAAERGVMVRLYRFPAERPATGRVAEALAQLAAEPTVTQRFKAGRDLMHLKSYCVDGITLRAGAANFSASGLKRQDNDLIIARGSGVCARFEADFEVMWKEGGK